ncbi:MAG: hypothetical protein EXR65_05680 [Dehalococcoidia bacterium]|nr:hypothetical protein [Dehalococcoidia bacterium]
MSDGSGLSLRASRRMPLLIALLVAAAVALAAWPAPVRAAPQADAPTVVMADPASITFRVRVRTDADLASATLNYKVLSPDGNIGGSLRAEVSPGRSADLSAQLTTNGGDRYIPVGSRITYAWEIVDRNGAAVTTPEQTGVFLDGRYQWRSQTVGKVTTYGYGGDDIPANLALEATAAAIGDIEVLLGVQLSYPVRVVVWRSSADGKAAQQPRSATFDSQVVTGGSRVSADVLHIYDSLGAFVDVTRHEAGHLVTKVAGDGPFTKIPAWLDEGTAVYAQRAPGAGYVNGLQQAIRTDQTLRLRNLGAATNQPERVDLFYGQSWATVKFMIDTYGQSKFAAVFREVKAGSPIDEALLQVIGVDQDGLYNAWRASVGLKPIDFPPVPRFAPATAQATQPPLRIPTSVSAADAGGAAGGGAAAQPAEAADGGGSAVTGIAVALAALIVAGGLGAFGLRLARRR